MLTSSTLAQHQWLHGDISTAGQVREILFVPERVCHQVFDSVHLCFEHGKV